MYKFLGIGAQKAGTTWLFEMLKKHPQVSFPMQKEAHFWDKNRLDISIEQYISNFQDANLIEGEITPSYAFLPSNTIQTIHQHLPNLKIIYILRNPIERAWSSAKMDLGRANIQFNDADDEWFINHFNSQGSLQRGDYENCLRQWRSVFKDEQILVALFDEIKNNPNQLLLKTCQHIGIDAFTDSQLTSMQTNKAVFSTPTKQLNAHQYQHLVSLYKEKISRLETYLNTDLSHWLK